MAHKRELSPGKWRLVVELPPGPGGARRTKTKNFHGGERAAAKALAALQVQYGNGTLDGEKMTVGEMLSLWLEKYAEPNLSRTSYDTVESFVRVHLIPQLGHLPLTKVRSIQIEDYYRRALKSGRKKGGDGGLSLQSVQHHHRVLRQAFHQALKWELIDRNPMELVTPPQLPRDSRTQRRRNAVDGDGAKKILEAAEGTRIYLPVLLALATGLRRGELLGLRWKDVDLRTGLIRVEQTLKQSSQGREFGPPKTESSTRGIHLPAELLPILRQHRADQAQRQLRLGKLYEDHGLILCWDDGRPFRLDYVTRAFTTCAQRLGLSVTFHGLRRSHSSLLQEAGEHPKVVSSRLGHKGVGITLDTYTEVSAEQDQGAAARMNAQLLGLLKRRENGAVDPSQSA